MQGHNFFKYAEHLDPHVFLNTYISEMEEVEFCPVVVDFAYKTLHK